MNAIPYILMALALAGAISSLFANALPVGPSWTLPSAKVIARKHRAARLDLRAVLAKARRK